MGHFVKLFAFTLFVYLSAAHDLSLLKNVAQAIQREASFATDHWAMQLAPGTDPEEIAKRHGHEFVGAVGSLKNVFLFKKKPETQHGVTHPHHNDSSEIHWFENQVATQKMKRATIISDPLFSQQWHLRSDSAVNINVNPVWQQGITGAGITIGVVDDGLEYTHPDIAENYRASASYDFNYKDSDPFPDTNGDDHGTSAAGVAGARDNSACGVGSAFRAGLSGLRLISRASTDSDEAAALSYKPDENHIYTNSWGPIDDGRRKEGPGRLASMALANGVREGRQGKGSIYVWAGGNGLRSGDNCNYDGWANSRYTISIGAVDNKGGQAWYSESCSMLVVSAPSSGGSAGITTTDLKGARGTSTTDCTSSFGGTSAAAPLAAGVIALVLEANPNLGWRDVQAVLIDTATKISPGDADWVDNGAGYHVNHAFGFGLVNAAGAVEKAKRWVNLGEEKSTSVLTTSNQQIPKNSDLVSTATVSASFTVEHVEVVFKATVPRRGDFQIVLVSPSGTASVLATPHSDMTPNYDWTFGTIRCWGENSQGDWQLKVRDTRASAFGTLNSWELKIYGH